MAHQLLFEIGCEEIPARFLPPALTDLERLARQGLQELRLDYMDVRTLGTPRRLTLVVEDVAEVQRDLVEEVKGPPERAAYGADGQPTQAAHGFARSQGVAVEDLQVKETPQGRYVFALRRESGRPTRDIIGPWLAGLITALSFPKSMRWAGPTRFARPIRWLVALLDETVIPVECAGVTSSNVSRGHRFLGSDRVLIQRPQEYAERLRENYVIVDPAERRAMIWRQVQELAASLGGTVEEDPELLQEVTFLVEYPTALAGSFDSAYLELPKEVLITPMTEHQRYFPVLGSDGRLLPHFIAVRNGTGHRLDVVTRGNEKVLAARLADARFFYNEDRKQPLEQRVPRLADIVFQEALGTMKAKVDRIVALSRHLARQLDLPEGQRDVALRAAYLCKADLLTHMVYEFPELQGIMGREYALTSGEPEAVAQAIYEHMLPRHAGDEVAQSVPGAVVALADRFDTLVGCFAAGLIPTGSQDPYALRRAATGIVQTVLRHGFTLPVTAVLKAAMDLYGPSWQDRGEEVVQQVAAFIRQRVRVGLMEQGCRHDLVDAVLAVEPDDLVEVARRATQLNSLLGDAPFQEALRVFQRAANLARQAETTELEENLLKLPEEQALLKAVRNAAPVVEEAVGAGQWREAVGALAGLGPAVDGFFDQVLVMDPDPAIRRNRLALLAQVACLFRRVADFSQLEG